MSFDSDGEHTVWTSGPHAKGGGPMPINAGKVFRQIAKLSAQAEWTDAELRKALSETGVDPDQFFTSALKLKIKYMFDLVPDRGGAYYQDVMSWEEFLRQEREASCPK